MPPLVKIGVRASSCRAVEISTSGAEEPDRRPWKVRARRVEPRRAHAKRPFGSRAARAASGIAMPYARGARAARVPLSRRPARVCLAHQRIALRVGGRLDRAPAVRSLITASSRRDARIRAGSRRDRASGRLHRRRETFRQLRQKLSLLFLPIRSADMISPPTRSTPSGNSLVVVRRLARSTDSPRGGLATRRIRRRFGCAAGWDRAPAVLSVSRTRACERSGPTRAARLALTPAELRAAGARAHPSPSRGRTASAVASARTPRAASRWSARKPTHHAGRR